MAIYIRAFIILHRLQSKPCDEITNKEDRRDAIHGSTAAKSTSRTVGKFGYDQIPALRDHDMSCSFIDCLPSVASCASRKRQLG